jgi:hypothetical protein
MQELLEPFGIPSASQPARTFLAAIGLEHQEHLEIALGSRDYLVSGRRMELIAERDALDW